VLWPTPVEGLEDIVDIAAGPYHSLALKGNGLVYAWGCDDQGQLGATSPAGPFNPLPSEVPGLTDIVKISAGADHSLALDSSGRVWGFGDSGKGQLGVYAYGAIGPTEITDLSGIVDLAAGYLHSVAIDASGLTYAWGDNRHGQAGMDEYITKFHFCTI
jgi:alpha-tubulin suppressor-like RCC1 family protein